MSQRHRTEDSLVPLKKEVALHPDDPHEPGAAWKPMHHHDPAVAKSKLAKRNQVKRHWKTKMWKRRTQLRRERAEQMRLAGETGGLVG